MRYACDGRSLESTPEFERRKVMGVNCRLELQRARAVDARRERRIVIERSPRVVVPAYEHALWLAHKACRTGYDNIGLQSKQAYNHQSTGSDAIGDAGYIASV